jgi:hypothetical protein
MLVTGFAIFFVSVLAGFAISDYVLYFQYTRHRDSWENEGKP